MPSENMACCLSGFPVTAACFQALLASATCLQCIVLKFSALWFVFNGFVVGVGRHGEVSYNVVFPGRLFNCLPCLLILNTNERFFSYFQIRLLPQHAF